MKKFVTAAAAVALVATMSSAGFAAGKKTGFASDSGQGNLSNENTQDNPGTTEISGPKGQVKQGKTANTTVDLPGNGR